jgi:hypothetical protein
VVAAVGDICDALQECARTAAVIAAIDPAKLILAGDNAYVAGTLAEYTAYYDPHYGPFKARTHPVPGNHEYVTPGAAGYFDYFNGVGVFDGPAGRRDQGYYSVDIGDWHVIALNSNVARDVGSPQEQWLRADLAASTRPCTLASFHYPRFSIGRYAPGDTSVRPLYQALQDFKADVVVVGHDHNYQRWAPMTAAGVNDPTNGVRQFVVGTGGRDFYSIGTSPNVEASNSGTWGVLELTLSSSGYAWRFVPVAGSSFTDEGSALCKPKPTAAQLARWALAHGSRVHADLATGPDVYRLTQAPRASFEVIVDGASGDLGPPLRLERLAFDGATVLQSGSPVGTGNAVGMRWENTLAGPVTSEYVRVTSGQCTTGCGADDAYRIRAYETTYAAARFNNSGGQATVVLLQNRSSAVTGRLYFWSAVGGLLHTQPFTLGARASLVLDLSSLSPLQGRSGSVTLSHDAPYGGLAARAVAIEPATGFAFGAEFLPRLP